MMWIGWSENLNSTGTENAADDAVVAVVTVVYFPSKATVGELVVAVDKNSAMSYCVL